MRYLDIYLCVTNPALCNDKISKSVCCSLRLGPVMIIITLVCTSSLKWCLISTCLCQEERSIPRLNFQTSDYCCVVKHQYCTGTGRECDDVLQCLPTYLFSATWQPSCLPVTSLQSPWQQRPKQTKICSINYSCLILAWGKPTTGWRQYRRWGCCARMRSGMRTMFQPHTLPIVLVPRLHQNVNMRMWGEPGISTPSLPLPFFMWQNTTVGSAHPHNFNVCILERGSLGMRLYYYPLTHPSKFELVHSCTSSRFPFILR